MDIKISRHLLLVITTIVKLASSAYRTDIMQDSCGCSYLDNLLCNPFHIPVPRHGGAGHIALSRSPDFSKPFYCQMVIEAPPGQRVQLVLNSLDIPYSEGCLDAMVQIYDGIIGTQDSWTIDTMCGNNPRENLFRSMDNKLTIFYSQSADVLNETKSLSLTYTYFHIRDRGPGACNTSHEFLCNNGICLSKNLRCDEIDNCRDGSDENKQTCNILSKSNSNTLILVIVGGLMGVVVVSVLISTTAFAIQRRKSTITYSSANRAPPSDENVQRPRREVVRGSTVLTPDIMRDLPQGFQAMMTAEGFICGPPPIIEPVLPPSYSMLFPDLNDEQAS